MKLTSEQLKQFDEEGYLFFPDYFSPEETQILKNSVPEVFAQRDVTVLAGRSFTDADGLLRVVSEAGGTRQFGPISRMPCLRALATITSCAAAPPASISAKPAVKTMAP